MKTKNKYQPITIGQVIIIHGEETNRGVWKIGVHGGTVDSRTR